MKTLFKPVGLAAAVAAVTAGYAGVGNAAERSIGQLGDMAIIPYYTVQDDWVTGVHIINSANITQVVKLRLRRGSDSADALDFNLIMSPYDEWTGFIDDSSGDIVFATDDTTCTAPALPGGKAAMPAIFRQGAEEGYIEVISMGSATKDQPIAISAKHKAGVPADCAGVRSNFFAGGALLTKKGVVNYQTTVQAVAETKAYAAVKANCFPDVTTGGPGLCQNNYSNAADSLKVSYFFRDATSGIEMGGSAVHVSDFSSEPWITNQQTGLFSGDVTGFDYPDLNGGPPSSGDRGLYNDLRDPAVLGVAQVLNDWSIATVRNVSTDWVVTMPGQYTMVDYGVWASPQVGFDTKKCGKLDDPATAGDNGIALCDFRDIPVIATLDLWDREEAVIVSEEGDLVISPAPPGESNALIFPYEVNVVEWTDGSNPPVLGSQYATSVDASVLGESGWARLSVSPTKKTLDGNIAQNATGQSICEYVPYPPFPGASVVGTPDSNDGRPGVCTTSASGGIPIVGFVAWERSFPANPDANYGRLIEHSFYSIAN